MVTDGLLGLKQYLKFYLKAPGVPILGLLFMILAPMQLIDTFTFCGISGLNHELYYARLYPSFVSLAFGYVVWLMWIEKEHIAEATLRVGEVAQEVTHDLRSPLAVLKFLLKTNNGLNHDEHELLSNTVDRIDKIASNLLETYKTNLKAITSEQTLVVFSQTVSEVIKHKNYVLIDNNRPKITFEFDKPESDNFLIILNTINISRSLDNLLNNAIEAVMESPDPKIIVRLYQKDDMAKLTITDNGNGADEHMIRRMNRKEFRHTTKSSGHGIGLNSVWKIIQSHQGDLNFEKAQTGGMIVRISLPMIRKID
jgi:C4-dicarboxylate-specific signal transduction histidine kinase